MSRSGGNTTGIGILAGQLDGKRLEILHELITAAGRIGLLVDPTQVGQAEVEAVGRNLDLELITRKVRSADDIGQGIDTLAAERVAAMNVLASALFYDRMALIVERTRALGLPTIYWWPELAREGGLIGFGPNLEDGFRLLARQAGMKTWGPALTASGGATDPGRNFQSGSLRDEAVALRRGWLTFNSGRTRTRSRHDTKVP